MSRDTRLLQRKIEHLERELNHARSAKAFTEAQLGQEIKAHEATRGVLQDLVLDRGGSNSTMVYLERRDEVLGHLRKISDYCRGGHERKCPIGKLLWELSTEAERRDRVEADWDYALRLDAMREGTYSQRQAGEALSQQAIFGAWPVTPQPDTMFVNGRDYEPIVHELVGLSDWLPTTRTVAGVPGHPAADGSQAETEPEGE